MFMGQFAKLRELNEQIKGIIEHLNKVLTRRRKADPCGKWGSTNGGGEVRRHPRTDDLKLGGK